jgi:ribosomal protein L19
MNQIIQQIERDQINKISNSNKKNFKVGDDIIVSIYIPPEKGSKSTVGRTQKITGRCIGIRNEKSTGCSFKVLKLEGTKSVFIFNLYSPLISVNVKTSGYARRAKLNYLKERSGKGLRIRTKKVAKK